MIRSSFKQIAKCRGTVWPGTFKWQTRPIKAIQNNHTT